ncbi:MAG: HDIG domain-containing metalloprotein [Dehalobacterium sp.]|jgi:putative nucleotidyltransferase with HDIG domain
MKTKTDDLRKCYFDINNHLLNDPQPGAYLDLISQEEIFRQYPFSLLHKLKDTRQSPQHHPEGSVWIHTLLVVNEAAQRKEKSNDTRVLMWAALLHDIGKPDTTRERKGRITAYNHDQIGAKIAREFLGALTDDKTWIEKVSKLIRWHMQILFVVKDLPFANINSMKEEVDIREVALLGLCDRLGRYKRNKAEEEEIIQKFLQKCKYHK